MQYNVSRCIAILLDNIAMHRDINRRIAVRCIAQSSLGSRLLFRVVYLIVIALFSDVSRYALHCIAFLRVLLLHAAVLPLHCIAFHLHDKQNATEAEVLTAYQTSDASMQKKCRHSLDLISRQMHQFERVLYTRVTRFLLCCSEHFCHCLSCRNFIELVDTCLF